MSLIYKTLFEIKFLHEFYLTDGKGESVFDFTDQAGRMNFLLTKFTQNRASVNDDLGYLIPTAAQSVFDNYRMKLLSTYSGFKIVAEVTPRTLTDGTIVYTPKIKIPENLNIPILLLKKNDSFRNLSNESLNSTIPAINYFTNENFIVNRTFPFLTANIAPFDSAAIYEQGELAAYGLNDTRQFHYNGISDQWKVVKGNQFVNKLDLLLINPVFCYSFDATENVTEASFTLKNAGGTIVRTRKIKDGIPFRKVTLNFNPSYKEENLVSLPTQEADTNSMYTLEVLLNNSITNTHTLLFWDNDFQFNDYWGLVNIISNVTNPDYRFFSNDGFLKIRKLASGKWQPAPIFEIAIKSRLAYWRYRNEQRHKLLVSSDITDFVESMDDNLILKEPRSASYIPVQFKATDATYHHLPNPSSYDQLIKIDKRLFLDICVSESKMFPAAPG